MIPVQNRKHSLNVDKHVDRHADSVLENSVVETERVAILTEIGHTSPTYCADNCSITTYRGVLRACATVLLPGRS